MPTELQWFDGVINSARGTGRTTRMINAANEYAKEHPEHYVLFIAANYQEKRRLRRLLTEDNIHVCTPQEESYNSYGYHVSFWDHYAAEYEVRRALDIYDKRVAGMIEYEWWKPIDENDNEWEGDE